MNKSHLIGQRISKRGIKEVLEFHQNLQSLNYQELESAVLQASFFKDNHQQRICSSSLTTRLASITNQNYQQDSFSINKIANIVKLITL